MSTRLRPPLAAVTPPPVAGRSVTPQVADERLVARNFLALGSGEVVARLVAFAATIYLARTLGAEYYGIIGFATAVVLYLSRVADGGMELGVGVSVVAGEPARLQAVAPTILTVRSLVAAALAGGLALLALLALPPLEGSVLALYGLTLLAVGASSRWIHLGLERAPLVAIVRTAGETLMVLLVLALVRGPADLRLAPIAQFLGDVAAATALLLWLRARGISLRPRLDRAVVRRVVPRAAPMVGASLLGLLIYNSDLLFLRGFEGTTSVGYYAAAYTLVSFLSNIGVAYALTLLPALTRLNESPGPQLRLYHSATAQVFATTLPIALGGTLLAPALMAVVFGPGYLASGNALRILVWAIPLSVLRDVAIAALMARHREQRILRLTAAAAVLNLVLNLVLIPRYSLAGAAIATVATEALRMATAFAFASAGGFRVASAARFWRPTLAAVCMTALLLAGPRGLWSAVALGAAGYLLVLAATGGLRWRDGRPVLTV